MMFSILDIINKQRVLKNLDPNIDPDTFPGGGGGTPTNPTTQPNTNVVVPGISITPNTTQEVAVGDQICFTATATIVLAEESERVPALEPIAMNGCAVYDPVRGYYRKNCGGSGTFNAEIKTLDNNRIIKFQSFYITGRNNEFNTNNDPPNNNSLTLFGVRSLSTVVNPYYFYWSNLQNCGTSPTSSCSIAYDSRAQIGLPNGSTQTLSVNMNLGIRTFRVRSNGNTIFWESQSGGFWQTHASIPIPSDMGDLVFFASGQREHNTITNIRSYKGSFQGEGTVQWSNTCGVLTINGNQGCFTHDTPGTCTVCVSNQYLEEEKCVDINVSPLFIEPVDINCNDCN